MAIKKLKKASSNLETKRSTRIKSKRNNKKQIIPKENTNSVACLIQNFNKT